MHYGTSSSRKRHDLARRQSSNTAIASFARGVHRTWLAEDGSDKAPVGCNAGLWASFWAMP